MDTNLNENQYSMEIGDGYSSSGGVITQNPKSSRNDSKRNTKRAKVILSDRDFEVLEFIGTTELLDLRGSAPNS